MSFVISIKGQVTIPKSVRDQLGLVPGSQIEFYAEHGKLIGVKTIAAQKVRKWRGRGQLPSSADVDNYLDQVRGADAHRR
ncbi:MAG: AbrB/MazE/SpoVT family DNA-binding domain-containing protein [Deltaproteobacteria bacterium]|nr:AbrB/MazE/SpoVT family DNA-binding domain-containing protein [Deltaproteobacteria bacterium]